jgi:hypothetical protein
MRVREHKFVIASVYERLADVRGAWILRIGDVGLIDIDLLVYPTP